MCLCAGNTAPLREETGGVTRESLPPGTGNRAPATENGNRAAPAPYRLFIRRAKSASIPWMRISTSFSTGTWL
jgi:hypothetical protein